MMPVKVYDQLVGWTVCKIMSLQQKLWISIGSFVAGFYTHKYTSERRHGEPSLDPGQVLKKTEQIGEAIKYHPERVPQAAQKAIDTILKDSQSDQ